MARRRCNITSHVGTKLGWRVTRRGDRHSSVAIMVKQMPSVHFKFSNEAGQNLAGILETGDSPLHGYAVFAHCFTCDKASMAAVRVSRALAAAGIGVLRFDFTGLGQSEGKFGRGLSADVDDIACAVAAMATKGMPVDLLIGHSFGGTAVLAAAADLPSVRAVAVIGAPFDAAHVLKHVGGNGLDAPVEGSIRVEIGGRPFELGESFIQAIGSHDPATRIGALAKPLLVLHAPSDAVVEIANASKIFAAAKHPKSFISLDDADHLLKRRQDAEYAAACILAWSSRYLGVAETIAARSADGVRVEDTGIGKFQVLVTSGSGTFLADEPVSVGGLGSGPTPFDLLGAALGACTAMTCRLYADRKGWPLRATSVEVRHLGRAADGGDRFSRQIGFEGDLDQVQRTRLMEIANKCPVHRTLAEGARIDTMAMDQAGAGEPGDGDDAHMADAEKICAEADGTAAGVAP